MKDLYQRMKDLFNQYKLQISIGLGVILLLIVYSAFAGGRHHHTTINNYETYNYQASGASAAMAGDAIDFTRDTSKWQVGAGFAEFDNDPAVAIGASKRFDEINVNIKLMTEQGDSTRYGYSIHICGSCSIL